MKRWPQYILSIAVSIGIFYALSRIVSFTEAATIWERLDTPLVVAAFLTYMLVNLFRAWRTFLILDKKIPFYRLYLITTVHILANNLLPARTGEFSYIYLIRKDGNVDSAENVSSLILSRILDAITASSFVLLSLIFVSRSLQYAHAKTVIGTALVGFSVIAVISALLIFYGRKISGLIRAFTDRLELNPAGLMRRLFSLAERSIEKLSDAYMKGNALTLVALSFSLWVLVFGMFWLVFLSLGIHLSFWQSVFIATFPIIISTLPIQPFGGFGAHESSVMLSLTILGVDRETAFGVGLASHIITLCFFIIIGISSYILLYRHNKKKIVS